MSDAQGDAVPYLPWKTFATFVAKLKESTVPARIDKSILPTFSGSAQGQLLAALRFLRLTTADGTPTKALHGIVDAPDDKASETALGDALVDAYAAVVDGLDLDRATAGQLQERFKTHGQVDGQTVEKAIRFFLAGLKAAGMTYSNHLETRGARTGGLRSSAQRRGSGAGKGEGTDTSGGNTMPDATSLADAASLRVHRFPLRKDLWISVTLPTDLTSADVDRLAKWLKTVPFEV